MIQGRVPFTGETHRQVVNEILQKEPPAMDSAVPGELKQIVLKALSKDRTMRYVDASTMANDLKSLQEELEVRAFGSWSKRGCDTAELGHITAPTNPYRRAHSPKYLSSYSTS
jgi:hypothetical protein